MKTKLHPPRVSVLFGVVAAVLLVGTVWQYWDTSAQTRSELPAHTLSLSIQGESTLQLDPPGAALESAGSDQDHPQGTQVELSAVLEERWVSHEWTGDLEAFQSSTGTIMDRSKSVTAAFALKAVCRYDFNDTLTISKRHCFL